MDEELKALLAAVRHALMNPTDDDGLRSWAAIDAVNRLDAYTARAQMAEYRARKRAA